MAGEAKGFQALAAAMAAQPLHEIALAEPGAEVAALGFTLGLAASWAGPVFWAGEEGVFAEAGAPYPPGLAAFGLSLDRLIVVRGAKREEVLWAAEQGLSAPGATVICALGAHGRPLDLKATRRLLLFAERNRARCLLLRPQVEASAAWTRWRVGVAPSLAEAREVGAPAFSLELVRNRAGPAGARFILDWNADECAFKQRMACDFPAASGDGSSDSQRARG